MVSVERTESEGTLLLRALAAHEGVVGDPRRFGTTARSILEAARQAGDAEAVVVALRAVAWFERSQLHNVEASALLDRAARLARRADLPHRLGEVLVSRAAVALELGRIPAARRDLDRAGRLVAADSAPDHALKIAALLGNIGRLGDATAALRRILVDRDASVDVAARAANNLALCASSLGHSRDAVRHIDHAARLAERVGPALAAFVAHNRGLILAHAGRLREGLEQLEQASIRLAAAGLPLGEYLAERAETLAALRALPEARELAEHAVRELDVLDAPLIAAQARLRVSEIALLVGDLPAAGAAAELAETCFRSQRRSAWVALAVIAGTEVRLRARSPGVGSPGVGDLDRARRAADVLARSGMLGEAVRADLVVGRVAITLGRTRIAGNRLRAARNRSATGPVLVRLQGRLAAALAAEIDGDGSAVLRHCRAGLAELAVHRSALASAELRALAAGHGIELGLAGLGCLLRSGSPSRVLDWVERIRAAALLTVEPPAPDIVRDDRAELATIQSELALARREGGGEPAALLARQSGAEQRIRRATWYREPTGHTGAAIRTGELVERLDGRTLVSYGRYDDDMFAVVLGAGRRRLVRLGPWSTVRFEGDALQFALRRMTAPGSAAALRGARDSARHSLDRLAAQLIEPLRLPAERPLVVIPARGTHRLPWSALHPAPVSVAPSATLWTATCARRVAAADQVVVVAGPDLPGAEVEADAVARCHPSPVVLVPPTSTAGSVLDAMGGADLVHLACHGLLRVDNPTFSALRVSDGLVTVHELDLRGIAPHRVVLAACDSAADVVYDGDESLGFVSALLGRGTAGIVASVVTVGDVEAVPLMRALHERIAAGDPMGEALHAARSGVDHDDPRGFVNWCAFTAYGAG